jgi:hypothetical protein
MKIELKNLIIGDKVWCGGDSGFCDNEIETICNIEFKFDENTGEEYKVIVLEGNRKFDSRDGSAITSPTAYYIKSI